VVGLECEVRTPGARDASRRRRSDPVREASSFTLSVDGVVVAVGQQASEEGAAGLPLRDGLVRADAKGGAARGRAVFVAGDAAGGPSTVIEAVASGRAVAAAVDAKLSGAGAVLAPLPERRPVERRAVVARNPDAEIEERVVAAVRAAEGRPLDFAEPAGVFALEEARREASRCLACGCGAGCDVCRRMCIYFAIEPDGDRNVVTDKCDGCGLCAQICPNQNITMVER